jgi:vomeronasal 2 receptor
MHTAALSQGIIQLLLYFTWVWVRLVVPDTMRGELFLSDITEEMTNHGLCVEFAEKIIDFLSPYRIRWYYFMQRVTLSRVIVAFGDTDEFLITIHLFISFVSLGNVWITTSDWYTTLPIVPNRVYRLFGGGLLFSVHKDEILGFKDFLRNVQPRNYPHDIFIQDVWSILFECPYFDQGGVRE